MIQVLVKRKHSWREDYLSLTSMVHKQRRGGARCSVSDTTSQGLRSGRESNLNLLVKLRQWDESYVIDSGSRRCTGSVMIYHICAGTVVLRCRSSCAGHDTTLQLIVVGVLLGLRLACARSIRLQAHSYADGCFLDCNKGFPRFDTRHDIF